MSLSCAVRPSFSRKTSFSVFWANSFEDLLKAQKLRAVAFGFCPPETPFEEIVPECDGFDPHARHLLVTVSETGQCVGTYRLLDPEGARKAGGFYTESEFDISSLTPFLSRTAELGRSCVHPDYRRGGVIALLWSALARTLIAENIHYLMGCASLDLTNPDLDPDQIYSDLRLYRWGDPSLTVVPHRPYPCLLRPVDDSGGFPPLPPLLKGYLRLGARCIGEPAHDPLFRTADFPVWLPISEMDRGYVRHFLRTEPTAS